MSDKHPDERSIDDILASIDEMLSQKSPHALTTDSRKDSVNDAVQASQEKLGLSSSPNQNDISELDLIALEDVDMGAFVSMGIEDLKEEPASHHTHSETNNEKPPMDGDELPAESGSDTSNKEDTGNDDKQTSASSLEQAEEEDEDEHTMLDTSLADKEVLEDSGMLEDEEPEALERTSAEDEEHSRITPRHRILLTEELLEPSAQEALPLWIEQEHANDEKSENNEISLEDEALTAESKAEKPEELIVPENTEAEKQPEIDEAYTDSELLSGIEDDLESIVIPSIKDKKPENTRATNSKSKADERLDHDKTPVNDETITFDIEEDIGVDTVYKIEDLDDNTELVEVMMADVLGSEKEDKKRTSETMHINLSIDDKVIKQLVQVVSDDVAEQVQYHMQTLLPALVKSSLQKHLKTLQDNHNESNN